MKRSEFLKTTAVAGIGTLCCSVAAGGLLTGCAGARYVDGSESNGSVVVPLSQFGDTNAPAGAPVAVTVRKTGAMQGPIYVVRDGGQYMALSMVCTHKGCTVRPISDTAITSFECPCHGSEFSSDGAVLSPPAKTPLVRYTVTSDANNIYIKL
jgi:cytochrome b6-f complex iron-sulfur subunit